MENLESYIIYILGYDLLHKELMSAESNECDTTYNICEKIAKSYLESVEYKDYSKSMYDMLQEYIENKNIREKVKKGEI